MLTTDAFTEPSAIGIGVFSLLGTWLVPRRRRGGVGVALGACVSGARASPRDPCASASGSGLVVIENGRATDAEGGQIVTMFLLTHRAVLHQRATGGR